MSQFSGIREFILENPAHLFSLGQLPKRIDEYQNVHYLLIARDHWPWIEPTKESAIVKFDAFVAALRRPNLDAVIRNLLKYEWLPVEGRTSGFKLTPQPSTAFRYRLKCITRREILSYIDGADRLCEFCKI